MKELLERLMELVEKAPTGYRMYVINNDGETDEVYVSPEFSDLLDEVQEFLDD